MKVRFRVSCVALPGPRDLPFLGQIMLNEEASADVEVIFKMAICTRTAYMYGHGHGPSRHPGRDQRHWRETEDSGDWKRERMTEDGINGWVSYKGR